MVEKGNQNELRGDGKLMPLIVHADNVAEAVNRAIISCYDNGARIETPKQKEGMTLGYDDPILIGVRFPDSEPKIYFPAFHDTQLGTIQYILEVTHGIHNHWKKSPEEPHFWGYTYNERFVEQLPFVFQRIKHDWDEKKRISGRDYQFDIWRAGEDIIIEQPDAPCWQRGILRFTTDRKGEMVMNYFTSWRSRDEFKAWNQNVTAQIGSEKVPGLMRLLRDKVSSLIGEPIKLGSYIDYSDSLHLYGLYLDRDNLASQIQQMKETPYREKSIALDDYIEMNDYNYNITTMKRIIAAQSDAESKGHGKQQPIPQLKELGYDIENFPYPEEWDSWPKSWDAEPDINKLARVVKGV